MTLKRSSHSMITYAVKIKRKRLDTGEGGAENFIKNIYLVLVY